jgi:hypothetical protein
MMPFQSFQNIQNNRASFPAPTYSDAADFQKVEEIFKKFAKNFSRKLLRKKEFYNSSRRFWILDFGFRIGCRV